MQTEELVERLNDIRSHGSPAYTNMYRSFASFPAREWDCRVSEKTACLFEFEGGARRVQFLTSDLDDLVQMLSSVKEEVALDLIGRDPGFLADTMTRSGFRAIARMQRWANRDISPVLDDGSMMSRLYGGGDAGRLAGEVDARQVMEIYTRAFDPRVSHLPSLDELREAVRCGEVVIHEEDGRIRTILQRTIEPKRFYIHQVYNDGEKAWLHALLLAELRRYHAQGGRYLYAWVQDTNIASQKMHAKYGMSPDGLWDIVYANRW